jgi:hypothetical protein
VYGTFLIFEVLGVSIIEALDLETILGNLDAFGPVLSLDTVVTDFVPVALVEFVTALGFGGDFDEVCFVLVLTDVVDVVFETEGILLRFGFEFCFIAGASYIGDFV